MASHDDANLIIRLYDLRREERLRKARAWFGQAFRVSTTADFDTLCPPGTDENAYFRMVVTYWEMVASFLNSGLLNKELFYRSGNELLFVWLRVETLTGLVRERYEDPTVYAELEEAGREMIEWRKSRSATGYETFRKRVTG